MRPGYPQRVRTFPLHARLGSAALAVAVLPASTTAMAQSGESGPAGGTIVVTGSAIPVEREKIGNTLTVIEGEAIDLRHAAYLQDVLREVPGVAVNQGGSFGALTQIRIRGAEGNHVLVLIDGIEVAAASTGEFDFSSLLAGNIDRVE